MIGNTRIAVFRKTVMKGMFNMNDKVLKTLEFHKIIDLLQEEAGSDLGKKLCADLTPSTDLQKIKTRCV